MVYYEKYKELSDEELLEKVQTGDTGAVDYILEKYKNLVRQKARTLFLIGGDKDDLIQEGMIGLYKAIRDFKIEKDHKFYPFAKMCISRQIYSAIKASNRKKNMPLNTYISIYAPVYTKNEEGKTIWLETMIETRQTQNPEKMIIDKERVTVIETELSKCLSNFEKEVLGLYLEGRKYGQIAIRLQKSPKSIDNALQRIKGKLNRVLKEKNIG